MTISCLVLSLSVRPSVRRIKKRKLFQNKNAAEHSEHPSDLNCFHISTCFAIQSIKNKFKTCLLEISKLQKQFQQRRKEKLPKRHRAGKKAKSDDAQLTHTHTSNPRL